MQERVEINYQGEVYAGHYFVEGVNKRQLTVYYKGKKLTDYFDSRVEETSYVEFLAEQLLLKMVADEDAEWGVESK